MTGQLEATSIAGVAAEEVMFPPLGEEKIYTLKFVLAGSSGVGKTQLARRIISGEFAETSRPTVGLEFGTRSLRCSNHSTIRAQIWDAAGELRFELVKETLFRGAVGVMLVYEISRRSTFDELPERLAYIRGHCHESIAIVMVGNKSDMSSKQREVSMVEGMRFARKHELDFFETSALENTNVEETFRQMVMSVARYLPQEKPALASNCHDEVYLLPKGWIRVVDYDDSDDDDGEENDEDDVGDLGVDAHETKQPQDGHETDETADSMTDNATNPSFDIASTRSDAPSRQHHHSEDSMNTSGTAAASTINDDEFNNAGRSTKDRGSSGSSNLSSKLDVSVFNSFVDYDQIQHSAAAAADAATTSADDDTGALAATPSVDPAKRFSIVRYENIWTGEQMKRLPLYPTGPSDSCIVSHVPRPPDPSSLTTDAEKTSAGLGGSRGDRQQVRGRRQVEDSPRRIQLKLFLGGRPSWSFSSWKKNNPFLEISE